LFACATFARAAENPAGRWEGKIQVPEEELILIVDLAQDNTGGWTGSITLPGLNIKGATLTEIAVAGSDLTLTIKSALSSQTSGPAKLTGHLAGDTWTGNFLQGGNSAPFNLHKTGTAQVDEVVHSSAISNELEGEWKGEYEMFGYKRTVSLKLSNRGKDGGAADFVVVGKRVNNLPVDLVTQEGNFLTVESHETGLSFEGKLLRESNELAGVIIQGGIEAPLVLHHEK
jgi:hypothetical protein